MLWLYIIIFIASCLLLIKSGSWAVKCLAKVGSFLKWSEFAVAFLLMALITSLPELFVSLSAAFKGRPELAFGNIIGSNIINLTLAVSIPIFIAGAIKAKSLLAQRSSVYSAAIAFLPVLLLLDGKLTRVDGIILLFSLFFYFRDIAKKKSRLEEDFDDEIKEDFALKNGFLKAIGGLLLSVALLLISAEGIVWSATLMASGVGVPLLVIAILLVALGTNLPEIIFSIKAASMGHQGMILGNLMGSVVMNSSLVLGLTVLIHPIEIFQFSPYIVGMVFTVFVAIFFAVFVRTQRKITKKEAVVLLAIYILFVATQLVIK